VGVAEERIDTRLRGQVAVEIGQQHIGVAAPQQAVDECAVAPGFAFAELAAGDGVEHGFETRLAFVQAQRLVARLLAGPHLGRGEAEDEDVGVAHVLADLDVGAVVGADGERAIQRQLHVAGAAGLGAGGGDLLRQVGARHQQFGHRDAVIGHEHQLEPAAQPGVVVDDLADIVDELDDALGRHVAGGRLAGEDHRARHPVGRGVGQHGLVARHHLQHVEQLALVFVDALDLHVEQAGRVDHHARGSRDVRGQARLVGMLDGEEGVAEILALGVRRQARELVERQPPAAADAAVDQGRQARVGLRQPAPRRDAVGHVGEALGPQAGEVGEDGLGQQVGMQGRDAVDLVAADDRKMRHAHAALAAMRPTLVDQAQATQETIVARPVRGRVGQELAVDAEDDLQVPRQDLLHQRHGPGLQRFGHQRVVGVAEDLARDGPGRDPAEAVLVDEQAHQLGHADGRVRVIEVDGHLVGQIGEPAVLGQVAGQDVLDAGAGEEVFLAQAQFAPGGCAVVGVEHPTDVLVLVLELGRACIVAGVEGVQVDLRRCHGLPQAQGADAFGAVAGDDHVIGFGVDLTGMAPGGHVGRVGGGFHPAPEAHRVVHADTRKFPGRTVFEPGVGRFDLAATLYALLEHAELVADAVAEGRQLQCRHAVEEARGQAAEAAVAQRGVGLGGRQVLQRAGMRARGHAHLALEFKRCQGVGQGAPDQELHRQVVDPARLGGAVGAVAGDPAPRQLLARNLRHRVHDLRRRGMAGCRGHGTEQVMIDSGCQAGTGARGRMGGR